MKTKGLNELSGAYTNLHTISALAESFKKNREDRRYGELKTEIENAGNKFVSASADREASAYVADYRRVRNIIASYVDSAALNINTLQSELKKLTSEQNRHKQTEE